MTTRRERAEAAERERRAAYHANLRVAMHKAAVRLRREEIAEEQGELLEGLYQRWMAARRMRRFVAVLDAHVGSDPRWPEKTAWLEWARGYIDTIDPLSDAALTELFAMTVALAPDPIDDEPWDEEEQFWRDMGWLDDKLPPDWPKSS